MNRMLGCFNVLMWTWLFYLLVYRFSDFASFCEGMSLKLPAITRLVLMLGSPFRQHFVDPATVVLTYSLLAAGLNLKLLGDNRADRLQAAQSAWLALLFALLVGAITAPFYQITGNLG